MCRHCRMWSPFHIVSGYSTARPLPSRCWIRFSVHRASWVVGLVVGLVVRRLKPLAALATLAFLAPLAAFHHVSYMRPAMCVGGTPCSPDSSVVSWAAQYLPNGTGVAITSPSCFTRTSLRTNIIRCTFSPLCRRRSASVLQPPPPPPTMRPRP